MNKHYRQGDLLFIKISEMRGDVKKLDSLIIQLGTATGHAHRINQGEIYETNFGQRYLVLNNGATVLHEEHHAIELEPGIYEIRRQMQFGDEYVRD